MYKTDVVAFFGNQKKTAVALNITEAAVCMWGEVVPSSRQDHVRLAMQEEQRRRDAERKKEERKKARIKAT